MSKQEWTKEVPVEDGWYWVRDEEDKIKGDYEAAKVTGNFIETRTSNGKIPIYEIPDFGRIVGDIEWLGPLTPPE